MVKKDSMTQKIQWISHLLFCSLLRENMEERREELYHALFEMDSILGTVTIPTRLENRKYTDKALHIGAIEWIVCSLLEALAQSDAKEFKMHVSFAQQELMELI